MRISKVISSKRGQLIVEDEDGVKIRRQGGTVAWRCNNPGNLKMGPFSKSMGALGEDAGGHAVFKTKEHGIQAQYVLLFAPESRYYEMTLRDAIARYAPVGDASNEPYKYATYLSNKTGIPLDQKFKTISVDNRMKLLETMWVYEGYKEGRDYKEK